MHSFFERWFFYVQWTFESHGMVDDGVNIVFSSFTFTHLTLQKKLCAAVPIGVLHTFFPLLDILFFKKKNHSSFTMWNFLSSQFYFEENIHRASKQVCFYILRILTYCQSLKSNKLLWIILIELNNIKNYKQNLNAVLRLLFVELSSLLLLNWRVFSHQTET